MTGSGRHSWRTGSGGLANLAVVGELGGTTVASHRWERPVGENPWQERLTGILGPSRWLQLQQSANCVEALGPCASD